MTSPVVDAGNCAIGRDQRGFARPIDIRNKADAAGGNDCDIGAFELQNPIPVAADDTYITTVNTKLTLLAPGVLGNDRDPNRDPLTAVKILGPSSGSLVLNRDGSLEYVPNVGFVGTDTFTYKVNDGTHDSNVATVAITIQGAATCGTSTLNTPPHSSNTQLDTCCQRDRRVVRTGAV